MFRRVVRYLRAPLEDDFPRQLNRFEQQKIRSDLARIVKETCVVQKQPLKNILPAPYVEKQGSDSFQLLLDSLTRWPVHVAVNRLLGHGEEPELWRTPQVVQFLSRVFEDPRWRHKYDSDTLLSFCGVVGPDSMYLQAIAEEVVISRDLEDVTDTMVKTHACELGKVSEKILVRLLQYASVLMDPALFLSLGKQAAHIGRLPIPLVLVPTLTKSEMIDLLALLEDCEFPDIICETVRAVGNELGRLSFLRIVQSESEREKLLFTLFRLKMKLDALVVVEGNPFYEKGSFFKQQILKALSKNFHHQATCIPLGSTAQMSVALLGLNVLSMKSLELIANRIQSFPNLLISVTPEQFSWLAFVFARHPQSWKKVDNWRQRIASPMAKALMAHAATLTPTQLISCCTCLMGFHNKDTKRVVGELVSDHLNFSDLPQTDILEVGKFLPTLKLADPSVERGISVRNFLG